MSCACGGRRMVKRRKVGTGVTAHWREIFDSASQEDMRAWSALPATPETDFRQWLADEFERLEAALAHFRLPAVGRAVVWDKENPRAWRYLDGDEFEAAKSGKRPFPDEPAFKQVSATHAQFYLTAAFNEQSSFWYLGRLMKFMLGCQRALDAGEMIILAGKAIMLGRTLEAISIKFGAARRIEAREAKIAAAADRGNATKKQIATAWHETARRLGSRLHSAPRSISQQAREVLHDWPAGERKPSERSLRGYLASLATRGELPEVNQ